jgi:hypothetical protein
MALPYQTKQKHAQFFFYTMPIYFLKVTGHCANNFKKSKTPTLSLVKRAWG